MFNRFTKEARAAVVLAQEVAFEAASPAIDVAHLVLGVLDADADAIRALQDAGAEVGAVRSQLTGGLDRSGLDGGALAALGVDLESVRATTDSTFGDGAFVRADLIARNRGRKRGHIPFTAAAKEALELSLREAVRLEDAEITGRHILLAVLRSGAPVAKALTAHADRLALTQALERGPRVA